MGLALYPRDELAKDANLPPEGSGLGGMTLAYNTRSREEVGAVLVQASAEGAKLLKPAVEAFWGGYSGYFSDPDVLRGRLRGICRSRLLGTEPSVFLMKLSGTDWLQSACAGYLSPDTGDQPR